MFEALNAPGEDPIIALMTAFRADPRPDKIDLGIGIYRDAEGWTPVFAAVREAERRLYEGQTTKAYVGLAGDLRYNELTRDLVLAGSVASERVRVCQTVGGSGALFALSGLVARSPGRTLWLPDPTWPNHPAIARAVGLAQAVYPYYDRASGGVAFEAMLEALKRARAGDVVLVHGCCHNPTGADLSAGQWAELGRLMATRGLLPFVDLAYQGFGAGLDGDAEGVRILAGLVPELLIATSASKNFGVYRERVGAAILVGATPALADRGFGHLLEVTRGSYSMPPDHGAATVRIVMDDPGLRSSWADELEAMRLRMAGLRGGLAEVLRRELNTDRFDFIARQRGMFSLIGLSSAEIDRLRLEHGIYILGDGRMNAAGLHPRHCLAIARAIRAIGAA